MSRIEILHGGAATTVQDEGRTGQAAYGVPVSGAMDRFAATAGKTGQGHRRKHATGEGGPIPTYAKQTKADAAKVLEVELAIALLPVSDALT